jgi:hypothetical protein
MDTTGVASSSSSDLPIGRPAWSQSTFKMAVPLGCLLQVARRIFCRRIHVKLLLRLRRCTRVDRASGVNEESGAANLAVLIDGRGS